MSLATTGLFHARWTDQIHDEWMRNLAKDNPGLSSEKIERVRDLMNNAVEDCLVEGHENLISCLDLPDPDDRHVLAAAIRCNADVIVTFNLKDFPKDKLAPYGIAVQTPDEFVYHQLDLPNDNGRVLEAIRAARLRKKKPPYATKDYLDVLEEKGFVRTVVELRQYTWAL